MISSSTSVHSIAPPPVFFRLAYLALVADNKLSHFFLSCSLVLCGNTVATNWLRTSNHVCIFNINVSVGDKVPNRVIFLFLTSSVLKFGVCFLALEPCRLGYQDDINETEEGRQKREKFVRLFFS